MTPAVFQEASLKDTATVLRLMQRYYAEDGYAFDAVAARRAVEGLLSRPERGRAWCIEVSGEVAGYFVLTLGYSLEYRGVDAFLDELYLLPNYRGRGIGEAVLQRVRDHARELGAHALHLEVEKNKPGAIDLYRRCGFRDKGRFLLTMTL
jgi:ribosomal protein S18 acetylase RimI-like enzyme